MQMYSDPTTPIMFRPVASRCVLLLSLLAVYMDGNIGNLRVVFHLFLASNTPYPGKKKGGSMR